MCEGVLALLFVAELGSAGAAMAGNLFEVYRWKQMDFVFPNALARSAAIASGDFVPENNLPLGVQPYEGRIFVTLPRWNSGVAASLAYVLWDPHSENVVTSPPLHPYPSWAWHPTPEENITCGALTSAFRMAADECGRLWVIDSGTTGVSTSACPPQIFVFSLHSDQLLLRYPIPEDQRRNNSLFMNIAVDVQNRQCGDAYAYVADLYGYGLVVYSWRQGRSVRIENQHFRPDADATSLVVDNMTLQWTDGLFGLALSPPLDPMGDRLLYFHPLLSFRENAVRTSVLRDEAVAMANPDLFKAVGTRGRRQSTASAMDRRGVLYFNSITEDAVACWDSAKPLSADTVGIVGRDHELLNFPNDMKVDKEEPQNVWVLSDRLPRFFDPGLDRDDYNFRVLIAEVEHATEGTVCAPANGHGSGFAQSHRGHEWNRPDDSWPQMRFGHEVGQGTQFSSRYPINPEAHSSPGPERQEHEMGAGHPEAEIDPGPQIASEPGQQTATGTQIASALAWPVRH